MKMTNIVFSPLFYGLNGNIRLHFDGLPFSDPNN